MDEHPPSGGDATDARGGVDAPSPNGGGRDPERLPPFVRPAADFVARIRATVHTKLLAGFLVIAVLLVGMGITSILVIREMNQEAQQLISLQEQTDIARQAIYAVTSQSHFRAMALITKDDTYNDKIAAAKQDFLADLDALASMGGPSVDRTIDEMRSINERYAAAGDEVLALYDAGQFVRALDLHISAEHAISHELEDELNQLIDSTEARIGVASDSLASLHRFLLIAVGIFSGVSLLIALGLGRGPVVVGDPTGPQDGPRAGPDRRRRLRPEDRGAEPRRVRPADHEPQPDQRTARDAVPRPRGAEPEPREDGGGSARPDPTGGAAPPLPRAAGRRRGAQRRRARLAHLDAPQPQHPGRQHPRVHRRCPRAWSPRRSSTGSTSTSRS